MSKQKFHWEVSQNKTAIHVKVVDSISNELVATFVARQGGTGNTTVMHEVGPAVHTHQGGLKVTFRSKKS